MLIGHERVPHYAQHERRRGGRASSPAEPRHKCLDERLDLAAQRRADEAQLTVRRAGEQDPVHLVAEARVQQHVGFVENNVSARVQQHRSVSVRRKELCEPPRDGDNDVHRTGLGDLLGVVVPPDEQGHSEAQVLALFLVVQAQEGLQHGENLEGELPRRGENEHLRRRRSHLVLCVLAPDGVAQPRDQIAQRLPAAGRSDTDGRVPRR